MRYFHLPAIVCLDEIGVSSVCAEFGCYPRIQREFICCFGESLPFVATFTSLLLFTLQYLIHQFSDLFSLLPVFLLRVSPLFLLLTYLDLSYLGCFLNSLFFFSFQLNSLSFQGFVRWLFWFQIFSFPSSYKLKFIIFVISLLCCRHE